MSRETPKCVSPIPFDPKFAKIKDCIFAFNSIVLDEKLHWYSEELSPKCFQNELEYKQYITTIGGTPMDYGTIRV